MHRVDLPWDKLAGITTDGYLNVTGTMTGEGKEWLKLVFSHWIRHQEVLYKSQLQINHVVDITKIVNFPKAKELNHTVNKNSEWWKFNKSRWCSVCWDHMSAALHISTLDTELDCNALVQVQNKTRFPSLNKKSTNADEVIKLQLQV